MKSGALEQVRSKTDKRGLSVQGYLRRGFTTQIPARCFVFAGNAKPKLSIAITDFPQEV